MKAKGCIIPYVNNVKKCGRGGKGRLGGVRTAIMDEKGCICWLRMTTMQIRRKVAQRCTWRKVNSDRVIKAVV